MRFNEALSTAADIAFRHLGDGARPVVLVRDLYGKIRVVLPEDRRPHAHALAAELSAALGVYGYAPSSTFLDAEAVEALVASARILPTASEGATVLLVDRLLMGTAWSLRPAKPPVGAKRFTLFSMKGGVGRSTTAVALAWHLATLGKRVLVLDLDLESPGVGSTLLDRDLPRFGVVDWFVEDAVGQGQEVLSEMVAESKLGIATPGKVLVAPCFGSDTGFRGANSFPDDLGDYLPKLGRAYFERGQAGPEPFAARITRMVHHLEEQVQPDIVLLDSRTGLHDASAALILAMGADTLMFAVDTRQTWTAYRFLFEHWRSHPDVRAFRNRLWVIGALAPRKSAEEYLRSLRDNAFQVFSETLYDPSSESLDASADPDLPFCFQPSDEEANHYPREVLFDDGLVAFDPLRSRQEGSILAAHGTLFNWFDRTFLEEAAP